MMTLGHPESHVVMMWRSNWQFLKNVMEGSFSIPGSDCTNNSITGTTIATFPESVRDPISGTAACEDAHTCTYGSGNTGDSEIKTLGCGRNPDTALLCGDQNCQQNHHIITTLENVGNSPVHQSGVVPLPSVLTVKEFGKVDTELSGNCEAWFVLWHENPRSPNIWNTQNMRSIFFQTVVRNSYFAWYPP